MNIKHIYVYVNIRLIFVPSVTSTQTFTDQNQVPLDHKQP